MWWQVIHIFNRATVLYQLTTLFFTSSDVFIMVGVGLCYVFIATRIHPDKFQGSTQVVDLTAGGSDEAMAIVLRVT